MYIEAYNFNNLKNIIEDIYAISSQKELYLITDSNVAELYLNDFLNIAKAYNIIVNYYIITPGETSKEFQTLIKILEWLKKCEAKRNAYIINMGGGVVSDIGGLVAAIYMRGISYINIPTTVLSQVDASIGGKTGINFCEIKNLVGSFYHPQKVYININFIKTLSQHEKINGLGEMFKYCILDKSIKMSEVNNLQNMQTTVYKCAMFKDKLVKLDFKDKGLRQKLNLGHTAGHAIESVTKLSHGLSVAVGILVATAISLKLNICSLQFSNEIRNTYYEYFNSYVNLSGLDIQKVIERISYDKKQKSHTKTLWILPVEYGKVEIRHVDREIWVKSLTSTLDYLEKVGINE